MKIFLARTNERNELKKKKRIEERNFTLPLSFSISDAFSFLLGKKMYIEELCLNFLSKIHAETNIVRFCAKISLLRAKFIFLRKFSIFSK